MVQNTEQTSAKTERYDSVVIDATQVPSSAQVRLSRAFADAAKRAFRDPVVQAEYETWVEQKQ